jgi:hypothetical protein
VIMHHEALQSEWYWVPIKGFMRSQVHGRRRWINGTIVRVCSISCHSSNTDHCPPEARNEREQKSAPTPLLYARANCARLRLENSRPTIGSDHSMAGGDCLRAEGEGSVGRCSKPETR